MITIPNSYRQNSGPPGPSKRCLPALLVASVALASALPAHALIVHLNPDASVTSLPNFATDIQPALTFVATEFHNAFTDPIDVNITVHSVAGTGTLEQSSTNLLGSLTYAQVKTTLTSDITTANDATSVATLPVVDPTGGAAWYVARAQAKALNLIANDLVTDGTYTFGNGFTFTYDPNNRAVPAAIDFLGITEHQVSEIMGRIGLLGTPLTGSPDYMPIDLFGYTGPGALDILPNQNGVNFSIDAGATLLKLYNNGSNGGDNKDWGTGSNDAFNAFPSPGVANTMSPVDFTEVDVIGYNLVAVPEPASLALLSLTAIPLLLRRKRP